MRHAQHHGRRAFGHVELPALRVPQRGGGPLDRGVEWRVVELRVGVGVGVGVGV